MQNPIKYYAVICKCGHVGRNKYIPITFPVAATNGREASATARSIARVKHHQKFAIINCREIDKNEYCRLQKVNSSDPYLRCKNKKQQKMIKNLDERIVEEQNVTKYGEKKSKIKRSERVSYINKKHNILDELTKQDCYNYDSILWEIYDDEYIN